MKQKSIAVVGAAETTQMGKIPDMSVIALHADAALNAMKDCGLKPSDIDGVATGEISPVELAHYLGICATYADGTSVGGCSFVLRVRHAAAVINEDLYKTMLITHGRSAARASAAAIRRQLTRQPVGPVRSPLRPGRPAVDVHHTGDALHEDLRLHGRRPGHGVGDPAGVGRAQPARQLQGSDHGRRRAELADDRLAIPHADVLPGHRRRRHHRS